VLGAGGRHYNIEMKFTIAALLFAGILSAQDQANPLIATSKNMFAISKRNILASADKIPDSLWTYQPTDQVRTVGQLFAHIADGQYEFCGAGLEGKAIDKGIEKSMKTKAEIIPALKEAFAYCDAAYEKLTDAKSAESVTFFGRPITRLGAMDFNFGHNMEHYGNLVTYMRLKNIVPPSSTPPPAAPPKK
jgi:uncharacterized damage-inducible protein DinB